MGGTTADIRSAHGPIVTVAAEHGAGGDLVAARVAEALAVPFLDRALPASLLATGEDVERPSGLVASLARASSMFAGEPVERMDLTRANGAPSWPSSWPGVRPPVACCSDVAG